MATQDIPQKSIVFTLIALGCVSLLILYIIYQDEMKIQQLEEKVEEQGRLLEQNEKKVTELESINTKQVTEIEEVTKALLLKDERIKKLEADQKELIEKTKELPSRGSELDYKEFYVSATGYTAYCKGCSGLTAWNEIDLRANPHLKVIAVDPSVIPLGSKVYVEGYGFAIAADKGGAIKGNKIDLFFPKTEQANQWGRKTVKIKVYTQRG